MLKISGRDRLKVMIAVSFRASARGRGNWKQIPRD